MKKNIIQEKAYAFSIRVINLYKYLTKSKKEYVLSKQVLRSGTAIGANVEEAIGGQSKKDFVAKISIAYKEARETSYWIRLLRDTNILTVPEASSLLYDCEEIEKIMSKIQITTRKTSKNAEVDHS